MINSKVARIAGFVGALGASAALVGVAGTSTGAYFTDSASGQMDASIGSVQVEAATSDTYFSFTGLMPGQNQSQQIDYTNTGTAAQDIWLYIPEGPQYNVFSGAVGASPADGLGRYGHFEVKNNAGSINFQSYNLASNAADPTNCPVDAATGNGGSAERPTSETDTVPYCAVPHYIRVDTNVPATANRHLTLTFGYTGKLTSQAPSTLQVPFQVVATQPGIRPDAKNF